MRSDYSGIRIGIAVNTHYMCNLLKKIYDATYPINSRIPSERELAEEYAASRITIKKTISMLVDDGLLYRKAGSGTLIGLEPNPGTDTAVNHGNRREVIGCIMEVISESFGVKTLRGITYHAQNAGFGLICQLSRCF